MLLFFVTNRECHFSSSACRNWRQRRCHALQGSVAYFCLLMLRVPSCLLLMLHALSCLCSWHCMAPPISAPDAAWTLLSLPPHATWTLLSLPPDAAWTFLCLPPDAAWTLLSLTPDSMCPLLSLPPDARVTGTCSHAQWILHEHQELGLWSPFLHGSTFYPLNHSPCPYCHCQQGVRLQPSCILSQSFLCTRAPRLFFRGSHPRQALGPPWWAGWINVTHCKQWCALEAGRGDTAR